MATRKKAAKTAKKKTQGRSKSPAVGAQVKASVAGIRSARKLTPFLALMETEDRKRAPKPRDGAEEHVRSMAALLEERSEISVRGVQAADITSRWETAEALAPLRAELAGFMQAVDDTILRNSSEAWKMALDILAVARGQARRDAELAERLTGIQDFLATGKRKDHPPEG